MGFFDKFFEKKVCSVCGGEIGLLGNRKLKDGNMCKECAKKLSPWFQERRESTVEAIQAQLTYREENLRQLKNFKTTRVLGDDYKMYIEEIAGVPSRFYVSNSRKPLEENPDIIPFQDVVTCVTDISSSSSEIKVKNSSGEWVSKSLRKSNTAIHFTWSYPSVTYLILIKSSSVWITVPSSLQSLRDRVCVMRTTAAILSQTVVIANVWSHARKSSSWYHWAKTPQSGSILPRPNPLPGQTSAPTAVLLQAPAISVPTVGKS